MPPIDLPLSYTIETERCRLRVPSAADLPHVFSATRHEGFNDGMVWDPPSTIAELEEPLRQLLEAWETGSAFSFSIDRRGDLAFLGRMSIRPAEGERRWDIGFWLHPDYHGQGYMREAAQAVIGFGFKVLDAVEIEAATRRVQPFTAVLFFIITFFFKKKSI